METKKEQVAVYVTEKVHKGFNTVTRYVANDGTKFGSEKECLAHEQKLETIEKGKDQFGELPTTLTEEQKDCILRLCFSAYDVSSLKMVTWLPVSLYFNESMNYLRAIGFHINYDKEYEGCLIGEKYVIASWVECEESDYPTYHSKAVLLSEIITALDSLKNALTQTA